MFIFCRKNKHQNYESNFLLKRKNFKSCKKYVGSLFLETKKYRQFIEHLLEYLFLLFAIFPMSSYARKF